jgi:cytochrome d ubiquinol oxidase subunit I
VKFAAIEALSSTRDHVPETLGGVLVDGQVRYGVQVPDLASLLAGFSPSTRIQGLDAVPPGDRPPDHLVSVVHLSFDVMVAVSFVLLALAGWFALSWWRRRDLPASRWFLRGAASSGVLAVVALEAGWIVTEVGRQPWTVVGLLRTRDAVTTVGNVWLFFAGVLVIYLAVGTGTVLALREMRRRWKARDDVPVPYGPHARPAPTGPPADAEAHRS